MRWVRAKLSGLLVCNAMTRLLLVRHGQSEWNAVGRWQGQADPPLTDLGRQQARLGARSLGGVDAVVASDLQRATETAVLMAAELGVGPVLIEPALRERDAGEWSGLTRVEIDERYPGYLDEPRRSAFAPGPAGGRRRPPGWEHDDDLLRRARAAVAQIALRVGPGDVLVITHGGLVYALEVHLGAPFERMANLEGRWFDSVDGRVTLGERVLLIDPNESLVTVPNQI